MKTATLVTVHDVMPETREDVDVLLGWLVDIPPQCVTLLVVPGRHWEAGSLAWLRGLELRGYVMAGHGWSHLCPPPRDFYHRIHSLLLSRDAGEHLSLERDELRELLTANHAWFGAVGLQPPSLYVPPAWAMGSLDTGDLREAPFRYYETLSGVYDSHRDSFLRLPLAGFEADTPARASFLAIFNRVNLALSRLGGRPLRIGIHPADHRHHLAGQLRGFIRLAGDDARRYDSLLCPA